MHQMVSVIAKMVVFTLGLTVAAASPKPALTAGGGDLVIGIAQYPSTFHPNFDSMAAKSFVLGATRRPFTAFDADWEPRCYLCVELPTF
ncbi:MAG: peptide ABC transporter substrate-binding protein, partial [Pseudomonadota bacterium]